MIALLASTGMRMKHLYTLDHRPLLAFFVLSGIGDLMAQVFGHGNLGFLVLTLVFMLIEMFTCMIIAFLSPLEKDDFGWQAMVEFWVKRSILLCLPLIGAAVDWSWHWSSDPDTMLGGELNRYATKAIAIGLLGYQLKQVLLNVLRVYKDLPLALRIIRMIDRVQAAASMEEGKEPPKLERRWYDKPKEVPYEEELQMPKRPPIEYE